MNYTVNVAIKGILLCFIAVILSLEVGCASVPTQAPYHAHEYVPYHATGLASFYGHGDGFNGQRMADGEVFVASNPHIAAHPSLPLGTKLKVVNLKNHKVLYVEVCDRMGRVHGRIIDLSYGAGKYFGMKKSGLVKVKISTITDAEYKKHVTIAAG